MGCGRRRRRRRGWSAENAARLGLPWRIMQAPKRDCRRQSAGLGAARALPPARRGRARGRLRHDRHGASPGRPGRDLSSAARARLRRLRARGDAGGWDVSKEIALARPLLRRSARGAARRSRRRAACRSSRIRAMPISASTACALRAAMPELAAIGLDARSGSRRRPGGSAAPPRRSTITPALSSGERFAADPFGVVQRRGGCVCRAFRRRWRCARSR